MENHHNQLYLCGTLAAPPVPGHEAFGEVFYYIQLSVPRLSGTQDVLPVTLCARLLPEGGLTVGASLALAGQLRSYNKQEEGVSRLHLTAYALGVHAPDAQRNPNEMALSGVLCKPPVCRTTPFGREIADLMLAVNRAYGKSDYIPCVAWGQGARMAGQLRVGDCVRLSGRLQSRAYQKKQDDGTFMPRVAYEVSVSQIHLAPCASGTSGA